MLAVGEGACCGAAESDCAPSCLALQMRLDALVPELSPEARMTFDMLPDDADQQASHCTDDAIGDLVQLEDIEYTRRSGCDVLCSHRVQLVQVARGALFAAARRNAEDLVADVIADLWQGKFSRAPSTDGQVLLFAEGVIRNRALKVNRNDARWSTLADDSRHGEDVDAWQVAARSLTAVHVGKALECLTPRRRQVATMHWLDESTCPQIAQSLGIAQRTVKELLRRARKDLCRLLEPYRPDGTNDT